MMSDANKVAQVDNRADARARWLDLPAVVIFALLIFTVALQFFTRYVLNDSFGWTEEIARYLLIGLGFSGCALCARRKSHIALEFFYRYLPDSASRYLALFCQLATAVFFLYCAALAVELAQRTNSDMASIALPKAIIHYSVAALCAVVGGLTLLGLRYRGGDSGDDKNHKDADKN